MKMEIILDKSEYVIHKGNLKQASHHGLVFKKFIELLNLNKRLA